VQNENGNKDNGKNLQRRKMQRTGWKRLSQGICNFPPPVP
jgi:hypothetical protein